MDVELAEVRDFLARHAPFSELPDDELDQLPTRLTVRYFRRDSSLAQVGQPNRHLFILRSGAVEIRDADGALVEHCAAGDSLGASTLVRDVLCGHDFLATEDTLALVMPADAFHELHDAHPAFAAFYDRQLGRRLRSAVERTRAVAAGDPVLQVRVSELIRREPLSVPPDASILQAAQTMREHGVSCLLILARDAVDGRELVGLVTDRDLRNRVLAAQVDPHSPVRAVMTPDPVTMPATAMALEALTEMVSRNIHHLPIMDGGAVRGLVSTTDLIRLERDSPVHLVGDVAKQTTVEGLADVTAKLPQVLVQLQRQDASPEDITRIITSIGDAVVRQLLRFAERDLGPAPVRYCFVVLGSAARYEQALGSDQDNALILHDDFLPEHHSYFEQLARLVSNGLAACGYRYCDGDVMATNPRWRQPLAQWRKTFQEWMSTPEPDALLGASIFFDMRHIHGDTTLYDALRRQVLESAPGARRFLAHLARNSLTHTPPLGFFRGLVVEKDGEHANRLDLKARGSMPVVDLARVFALSAGVEAVNTTARLRAAESAGRLGSAEDLIDAYELISYIRLEHQAGQVRAGHQPDNFVAPESLGDFQRRTLKDAFGVIKSAQGVLEHVFPQTFVS